MSAVSFLHGGDIKHDPRSTWISSPQSDTTRATHYPAHPAVRINQEYTRSLVLVYLRRRAAADNPSASFLLSPKTHSGKSIRYG